MSFPQNTPAPPVSPTRLLGKRAGALPAFAVQGAFSLVELLMVVSVMIVAMAFAIPAFTAIKSGGDVTKAVYDISGALDEARTYSLANNTYTWVGFYEENESQPNNPATAGTGHIVISIVASEDGTSYNANSPAAFGASGNTVSLVAVNKLIKIDNMHMAVANTGVASTNTPYRPPVQTAYQIGSTGFQSVVTSSGTETNPVTFTYPLTAGSAQAQYTFTSIIEFNPQGEASKIVDGVTNGPQNWMEIAIQPTHGNTIDPKYAGTTEADGAILIEGITGRVEIFRQ